MGPIKTRAEIFALLRKENRAAHVGRLVVYTDLALSYMEACDNLARYGAVAGDPKTGAPMINPYLAIRSRIGAELAAQSLQTGDLWDGWTPTEAE